MSDLHRVLRKGRSTQYEHVCHAPALQPWVQYGTARRAALNRSTLQVSPAVPIRVISAERRSRADMLDSRNCPRQVSDFAKNIRAHLSLVLGPIHRKPQKRIAIVGCHRNTALKARGIPAAQLLASILRMPAGRNRTASSVMSSPCSTPSVKARTSDKSAATAGATAISVVSSRTR